MADHSAIEWTEYTWNPVTGCSKISAGCLHCYAERMCKRLKAMGSPNYAKGFEVAVHEHMLDRPLKMARPRMVFVNSMGDLFHDAVPTEFIRRAFDVMRQARWHTFQVLTKRSNRLVALADELPWPDNIWMGVTVESMAYASRIDDLRRVGARVRFLSLEPLLGPLDNLDLSGIGWAIVGGESGPGARPMLEPWVRTIKKQCEQEHIPFFFKQWGGVSRRRTGRVLEGRLWSQMPELPRPEAAYA